MNKKVEHEERVSLVDLPEATLTHILERLTPAELCVMAQVSTFLRDRCRSDDLWEKHFKRKWSRLFGEAADKEWKWHVAKSRSGSLFDQCRDGSLGTFEGVWPALYLSSFLENSTPLSLSASGDSIMALNISLENGSFWFPAQVYKNGGFSLYRYNAIVSYDFRTNSFHARQRYGALQTIEITIPWEKLAPMTINPRIVYSSECLNELKPGDHIEIQWRAHRDLFYDWWYAVVGHLGSCHEQENRCLCVHSDILIVSFIQYPPGSIYRRVEFNRKIYREQTFRGGGYYGGIRKLRSEAEIEIWRNRVH